MGRGPPCGPASYADDFSLRRDARIAAGLSSFLTSYPDLDTAVRGHVLGFYAPTSQEIPWLLVVFGNW